jgi:hypothetical protein
MLKKVSRKDCLSKYKSFPIRNYDEDQDEEIYFFPKVINSYVLTLPSKSFKGHITALGVELANLSSALEADSLIFLGDSETPWLYQNSDYKPVKQAQEYLADRKVSRRFNGALEVDTVELPIFIKHLAWLIRCNAALPYIHFTNKTEDFIASICQYGNLHLSTLKNEGDKILSAFIDRSKFEYGDTNSCRNSFGKTDAIPGRKSI